ASQASLVSAILRDRWSRGGREILYTAFDGKLMSVSIDTSRGSTISGASSSSRSSVRGGWFDRQKLSPVTTSIAGCTWGGSAIKNDIVAACRLHLEFGNRVLTSRIREVLVIRGGTQESQGLRPIQSRELFRSCYGSRWESASAG
ncbi:MAG: hypothetical protein ACRD3M_07445, partial [Thermoanaerobaculia bacterium]